MDNTPPQSEDPRRTLENYSYTDESSKYKRKKSFTDMVEIDDINPNEVSLALTKGQKAS